MQFIEEESQMRGSEQRSSVFTVNRENSWVTVTFSRMESIAAGHVLLLLSWKKALYVKMKLSCLICSLEGRQKLFNYITAWTSLYCERIAIKYAVPYFSGHYMSSSRYLVEICLIICTLITSVEGRCSSSARSLSIVRPPEHHITACIVVIRIVWVHVI